MHVEEIHSEEGALHVRHDQLCGEGLVVQKERSVNGAKCADGRSVGSPEGGGVVVGSILVLSSFQRDYGNFCVSIHEKGAA